MNRWSGLVLAFFCVAVALSFPASKFRSDVASFWTGRTKLLDEELNQMLGNDVQLSSEEKVVNDFLMRAKQTEMSTAFQTLAFYPSQNFLQVKTDIDASDVFKFIRQMPKGSVLHAHDKSLTPVDWVISTLTYWDDLYMCISSEGVLLFKFFYPSPDLCQWKLVSEERSSYSSPQEFDAFLLTKLSMNRTDLKKAYPDIDSVWTTFEDIFTTMDGLISYSEAFKWYLERALLEMMNDQVTYFEFRGSLPELHHKNGTVYSDVETMRLYVDVIDAFTTTHGGDFFGGRYIYAPTRHMDPKAIQKHVDLAIQLRNLFPRSMAGFDLVGQEDLGLPLTAFIEPLLTLREQDPPVPVFFHAGETNWEGMSTDENLFDAFLLNASRIGHAYALTKHPQLLQMGRDKDVPIEVCPISNQVLMLVDDLRNHPAAGLVASSYPIVISSDDSAMWQALPLSHDFYEAFMALGGAKADLRFLKKLALNSIRYSSLDSQHKNSLEALWKSKWDSFIQKIIVENNL